MLVFAHRNSSPLLPSEHEKLQAALHSNRPVRHWRSPEQHTHLISSPHQLLPEDRFEHAPYTIGDWVIAGFARLDNRPYLISELGSNTSDISDTELLAQAWHQWGKDGLNRIYGDFALISWQLSTQTLHIAVDHLSHTHLYYYQDRDNLLVSTLRAPLLTHIPALRTLNTTALLTLLTARFPESDPWQGIQHVPAGHVLTLDVHGNQTLTRWWQPSQQHSIYYRDPRDYSAALKPAFESAMKSLLRSSQNVASTLSGGLDSSLATAYAADFLAREHKELVSYTSSPASPHDHLYRRPNWDADEWLLTEELAALHPNIRHIRIQNHESCLLDHLSAQHAASWTPVRNTANCWWLQAIAGSAAAQSQRIILTGGKGNASLSYAGTGGLARLLPQGHWRWAWQHLVAQTPCSLGQFAKQISHLSGLTPLLKRQLNRKAVIPGGLMPAWLATPWRDKIDFVWPTKPTFEWKDRCNFLLRETPVYKPDFLQQFGVLMADPFADRALIEQLLSYPPEAFVGLGFERLPARLLGEGLVPDSIRWRTRRGEQAPDEGYWIIRDKDRYLSTWQRLRENNAIQQLFDINAVDASLSEATSRLGERLTANSLHRLFDICLFIENAQQHWHATLSD
jgi:Asparagine synthase (glutamine-hydrolyzing)